MQNNNNPKLIRITTVPVSLAGLIKGQHRYMAEQGFEVVGVSSSGKALDEVRQNEGIRTEVVEMTRTLSPAKDLKSLWQFYKLCRREKPTIVHSHTPKAGIVGMMGAWLARVPIRLHTVAGMPLMETAGMKRKLLDVVEKMTYAFATRVYPNSHGLYDFIVEGKYTKPDKLHVIANGSSNGIDTSLFSPDNVSEDAKRQLVKNLRSTVNIEEQYLLFVNSITTLGWAWEKKYENERYEMKDIRRDLITTYNMTANLPEHYNPIEGIRYDDEGYGYPDVQYEYQGDEKTTRRKKLEKGYAKDEIQ